MSYVKKWLIDYNEYSQFDKNFLVIKILNTYNVLLHRSKKQFLKEILYL
jgi:hypothetical protein